MIIVKLKGGLGNQLFQYAFGFALARRNNDVLKLDLGWYRPGGVPAGDTVRTYALGRFAISAQEASEGEIARVRPGRIKACIKKVFGTLRSTSGDMFDPEHSNVKGDVYIEGFFQNAKYFQDAQAELHKEFQLRDDLGDAAQNILGAIERSNSVSIHIRRGDYITNASASAFHGSCSPQYYYSAIELIIKKTEQPIFFVFSDDIDWVKKNIAIPDPVTYVSGADIKDYEELILMGRCKHNIVANSSFSWWGAWLNGNPNKIIVTPKRWFNNPAASENDIVPNDWVRL